MASVDPLTPITTSPANDNNATAPTNIQSIASPNDTSTTSAAVTPQKNSGNTSSSATPMETEIAFPQPVPIKISNDVIKQEPAPTLSASASISTPLTPAKRPRHKPSERRELLEKAVRDVQEQNISMRKAASRYNLAKSSLCDYVRKNRIVLPNNRCKQPSVGSLNNTSNNNNSGSSITGVDNNHLNSSSAAGSSNNSAQLGLDATKQLLNHSGPFNFALETLGSQVSQAGSVITRLESPWNNVSGLPTQVPMQNWSSPHAKSISVLSQPPQPMASAASPPKVNSPTTNFSVVSSSSGFIYASTPTSVNETVSENTNSNINNPSSSTTAATIPALSQFTLSASDALLTASPLSRSLASIYASPQVQSSPIGQHQQPQQSFLSMQPPPPPAQVGTQLASNPLIFPTTPADQNALLKTLRDLMNVATKTVVPQQQLQSQQQQQQFPQPQLLPNLFFSLPLDFQSAMPDPSSSASSNAVTTSSTSSVGSSDDLLRKIHLSNCFAPLVAPPGSAQPTAGALINTDSVAAVSVIARFQMACARELIDFINKSPSPFHVVRNVAEILTGAGFRELSEQEPWKLATNDCVFVTKNSTSLFAIAVGGAYKPGDGFSIIGAHTDSPGLRLKPISERVREGFVELGVQTYGAGIWHTWFDRDLTLAGRCILSSPTSKGLQERLVQFERPLVCIPSLAIHLDRDVNKSFSPDPEKHLAPIISTTIMDQLNTPVDGAAVPSGHPAGLMRLLASELDCAPTDIVDLELCLADTQPAAIGGLHEEFVHAPRLDNQFCAYTSVRALVNSLRSLKEDSRVRVVCLYDHEEIGSRSMQGANSVYTECLFRRITEALATGAVSRTATPMETADMSTASSNNNTTTTTTTTTTAVSASANGGERCLFERTMAKSFFLSADQAHAVHPSYPEKHEPAHKPGFHQGIVIKHHCSQRYATNGITSAIVKEVARLSNVPIQEFVAKQDSPCGSTIGPIVASQLGVMTADVGGAQLAMHSVRETTCTSSVGHAVTLFTGFYEHLGGILANFQTLGK